MRHPKVLRPYGYPSQFNTPRNPRDVRMVTRKWLPLHKIWIPLEVALVTPTFDADLIASFNRIPLGSRPFVITFESHLPRLFNHEDSAAFRFFSRQLADARCRAIVPISGFARRMFLNQHRGGPVFDALKAKLTDPIHPNIMVPETRPRQDRRREKTLRCVFVGGHFIRKGGLSVLHAAREAHRLGWPIEFHIVSAMTMGAKNGVWTDPVDLEFATDLLSALALPQVHHHGQMANADLLDLLSSADVNLLPTLSDTYGYSVIESFAMGVPAIGTSCCALPEVIDHERTGYLVDLPVDDMGVWAPLWAHDHNGSEYRRILGRTVKDVGMQVLSRLETLMRDRDLLETMSENAFWKAREGFASSIRDRELEAFYLALLDGPYRQARQHSTS